MNISEQKKIMVRDHLIARGISDSRVLEAMKNVRRENFMIPSLSEEAYEDNASSSFCGQTISQPYIVALMTEKLEIFQTAKILEIGTGSGYQTAILRELCSNICTVEKIPELSKIASGLLSKEGYNDIKFRIGSGYNGWPDEAPFDRIIVTCAPASVPEILVEQMKDDAIMLIPAGGRFFQTLYKISKNDGKMNRESICSVRFIEMIE